MKSSNPVLGKAFNQSSNMQVDQLEQNYNAPAASSMRTGRMTLEDVVAKTGFLFAILKNKNFEECITIAQKLASIKLQNIGSLPENREIISELI